MTDLAWSDIRPGMILWLRNDAHLADSIAFKSSGLEHEALDHPILVVSRIKENRPAKLSLIICKISTSNLRHLDSMALLKHDEVSKPWPTKEILTFAKTGVSLQRKSFVKAYRVYSVTAEMVRPLQGSQKLTDCMLDEESCAAIKAKTSSIRQALYDNILEARKNEHQEQQNAAEDHAAVRGEVSSGQEPESGSESGSESESKGSAKSEDSICEDSGIPQDVLAQTGITAISATIGYWEALPGGTKEVLDLLKAAKNQALSYAAARCE